MKTAIVGYTQLIVLVQLFTTSLCYTWTCPAENSDIYYDNNGRDVELEYQVLSNSTFSISWASSQSIVALVNLEYKCTAVDDRTNWNEMESKNAIELSEITTGSEEFSVSSHLKGEVKCIVYGCYLDEAWYDFYYIKSQEFILSEPSPASPSPSPSPSPLLPNNNCDCSRTTTTDDNILETVTKRNVRSASEMTMNSQGERTNVSLYVIGLVILGLAVCVLSFVSIYLLLRVRELTKKNNSSLDSTFLI